MASSSSSTGGTTIQSTIARDLGEQFSEFYGVDVKTIADPRGGSVPVLVVPRGRELKSARAFLDEFRGAPDRRSGTAKLLDLDSFVAHVNRFADADSALFANPDQTQPSVTAVLDYHEAVADRAEAAKARFGRHRAFYPCPLAEEWKAWSKVDGQGMSQQDFAQLLEDRITDVVTPPTRDEAPGLHAAVDAMGGRLGGPQALHSLSRGLMVNVSSAVKQAVTLETGEVSIIYDEVHNDGTGAPIKTPNLFVLQVPVFFNGPLYWVPVRLRYRVNSGKITWSFHLYRADRVFKNAFDEITQAAREGTGLPLFVGSPEA